MRILFLMLVVSVASCEAAFAQNNSLNELRRCGLQIFRWLRQLVDRNSKSRGSNRALYLVAQPNKSCSRSELAFQDGLA